MYQLRCTPPSNPTLNKEHHSTEMASSLDPQSNSGSSIVLWGSHPAHTTPYAQFSEMPPEIMENIFEQLATKTSSTYEPDVKKALLSCLFLSKYLRDFALYRLFQSMEANAYFPRLDLLLAIIHPSSLEWMSVLPYIRNFVFVARCHSHARRRVVELVDPSHSDDLLPLLYALAGDKTRRLTSLVLRIYACRIPLPHDQCPHFTKEFQAAVSNLLKRPSLQSVEIRGAGFLPSDFLKGTYFRQLSISTYDPYSYITGSDSDATPSFRPDEEQDFPLRSLTTDTSFPRSVRRPAVHFLENLDHLHLEIGGDSIHMFKKVEDILQFSTSLKTLKLQYCELYAYEAPPGWSNGMIFGELQTIETLELSVWIGCIEEDIQDEVIPAAGLGLALLFDVLDTIHKPMRRLTKLKWIYQFATCGSEEAPFHLLERWLQTNSRWEMLDERLTSGLYPVLSLVEFVIGIPHLNLYRVVDEDTVEQVADLDLEIATRMESTREIVFPRLVASLGEGFKVVAKY